MSASTDNILGFLSLLAYMATILPSNLKVAFPAFKLTTFNKFLLKNRRSIGICTFVLAAAHAYVVIHRYPRAIMEMDFYRQSISGLSAFVIFAVLALTSNNWSIKKLKKNWKRLHSLTYIVAFILPWHIFSKMSGQWNMLTVVSIVLSINLVLLWLLKKYDVFSKTALRKNTGVQPEATGFQQEAIDCFQNQIY